MLSTYTNHIVPSQMQMKSLQIVISERMSCEECYLSSKIWASTISKHYSKAYKRKWYLLTPMIAICNSTKYTPCAKLKLGGQSFVY